jgi:hypothetical protein
MPVVGLHLRSAKPFTQCLQAREVVLDLDERCGPLAPWQILKQLGVPRRSLLGFDPDDAPHELTVQEEIIGTRRELDQAV